MVCLACMVGIVWMAGVVCKYVGYGMFDMTVCMVCMVCMVTTMGMECLLCKVGMVCMVCMVCMACTYPYDGGGRNTEHETIYTHYSRLKPYVLFLNTLPSGV